MCIKMILFDLDGTLLPMDQDAFIKKYFGLLAAKLAPYGYESTSLLDAIWSGTAAMVKNDGSKSNETVFWDSFAERFGENVRDDIPLFDSFYRNEFAGAKEACGYNAEAAKAVSQLKERGFRVALATNPLFPAIATETRIRWAGLEPEDFELYTTYEHFCYCKPNPAYYEAVAACLHVKPEECLMVGNDVSEDMVAQTVGMKVFLLTDCLLNKKGADISVYPHGDFAQLLCYMDTIRQ